MKPNRTTPKEGSYRVTRKFAFFPIKRVVYNPETEDHETTWFWLRYIYTIEAYQLALGGWTSSAIGGGWPFDSQNDAETSLRDHLEIKQRVDELRKQKALGIYNEDHQMIHSLPNTSIHKWPDIIRQVMGTQSVCNDSRWCFYIYIPEDGPDIPCEVFQNLGWGLGKVKDSYFAFVAYVYPPPEPLTYQPKFRLPDKL